MSTFPALHKRGGRKKETVNGIIVNLKMSKRFNSVWRLLLGSFITMLGFGSCKTAKQAPQEKETLVLYGPPPPSVVERQKAVDEMRLLYGAPPIKVEREKKK